MSDREGQPYIPHHNLQLYLRQDQILRYSTLLFGTMSLNYALHQWYSCPRVMIHVCICYPTVLWVIYEAWSTSDRERQTHLPHHDLQLHSGYAHLLHWFLESRDWTMHLISGIGVQGRLFICGNAISLFWECYMRHEIRLVGVGYPIYRITTSNYTQDMLSYYAVSWNRQLEPCTSALV